MLQQNRTANKNLVKDEQSLILDVLGLSSFGVQISGTFVATLQFEGSIDGLTYTALTVATPAGARVSSATAGGIWQGNCAGLRYVRVRISAYTSGSVVVYMNGGMAGDASAFGNSVAVVNADGTAVGGAGLTPTSYSLVIADAGTAQTATITQTGLTNVIVVEAPDISTATFTLELLDSANVPFFSMAGYAGNTTHRIVAYRNIVSGDKIKITTSGAVSGAKTFTVKVR